MELQGMPEMQGVATQATSVAAGGVPMTLVAAQRARTVYYGSFGTNLDRREFDAEYVRQLAEGEPSVEQHFTAYFGDLVRIKLRRRGWSAHDVEDVRQETFLRVIQKLRRGELHQPDRLGAFVNSVCNNIMLESYRARLRNSDVDPAENEPADTAIDMDGDLIAEERKKLVRIVLEELPEADRAVLRMVFWEDTPREDICKTMKVDRAYLRVLLHRARLRFKALATASSGLAAL
ncbi:MAG TPA: sigma-70 family RNA polymerase sigma factor [Terriglobia bacterium]|nr:sigma-70 family RNA polymerase sigma factor [Terriglobia bacterium]